MYPELFDLLRQYNVYHDHYCGDVLSFGGSENSVKEIYEREDQSVTSDDIRQRHILPLEYSDIDDTDGSQYVVDGSQYLNHEGNVSEEGNGNVGVDEEQD